MDASLSSDPHAPDIDVSFPAERWVRGGADPNELAELHAEWDAYDPDTRHSLAERIGSISDGDLREFVELRWGGLRSGAPSNDETALLEQEAIDGPWTEEGEPFKVGAESFPLYSLSNNWVGTRIGDAVQGMHLVAPDLEALIERVQHEVSVPGGTSAAEIPEDVAAWQKAKHLADLRKRAGA